MKINAIRLNWFRGGAGGAALLLQGKSAVVYGPNGAGKSSFVDAIEYATSNGKLSDLAHEHSGRNQILGILNTHRPHQSGAEISIDFVSGACRRIVIGEDGVSQHSGAENVAIQSWPCRQVVLRQAQLASFISSAKGEKYSALLPLLGLQHLETQAENLRQVAKAIFDEGAGSRSTLQQAAHLRRVHFANADDMAIQNSIAVLYIKYCATGTATNHSIQAAEILALLENQITRLNTERDRYNALKAISEVNIETLIAVLRTLNTRLAASTEALAREKARVLEETSDFVTALPLDIESVTCPSCGTNVRVADFKSHVQSEQARLRDILDTVRAANDAAAALMENVNNFCASFLSPKLDSWRAALQTDEQTESKQWILDHNPERYRRAFVEPDIVVFEKNILPFVGLATSSLGESPREARELFDDHIVVSSAIELFASIAPGREAARIYSLQKYALALEVEVRKQIRTAATRVVDAISNDVKDMWTVLHPQTAIDGIRLYLPQGDKAVDIALCFYGVQQNSPRLTLSEGYRNSLGLCIFLAVALRPQSATLPILLDDVVISMDRAHRGMVEELLRQKFSDRQVVIFTHDRDWFTDLRVQLAGLNWSFKQILPFESPGSGIRIVDGPLLFADAHALVANRPDSAVNEARKILDIRLGRIAEKLKLRFEYLSAEKNDRRMAVDFLERLIADGRRYKLKTGSDHQPHVEAVTIWQNARIKLVTWANRGSHSHDVEVAEAQKVVDASEAAINIFNCTDCGKTAFANRSDIRTQCDCGKLRWVFE